MQSHLYPIPYATSYFSASGFDPTDKYGIRFRCYLDEQSGWKAKGSLGDTGPDLLTRQRSVNCLPRLTEGLCKSYCKEIEGKVIRTWGQFDKRDDGILSFSPWSRPFSLGTTVYSPTERERM